MDPLYSCEDTLRVGDVIGDGAKFVCNVHHLMHQRECLYYGFGVADSIYFETSLRALLPSCRMFVFDPSDKVPLGMSERLEAIDVTMYKWGLWHENVRARSAERRAVSLTHTVAGRQGTFFDVGQN